MKERKKPGLKKLVVHLNSQNVNIAKLVANLFANKFLPLIERKALLESSRSAFMLFKDNINYKYFLKVTLRYPLC